MKAWYLRIVLDSRVRFLLFLRAVAIGGEVGAESAEAFSGQAPDADSGTICLFELSIVRDLPTCGKLRLCMLGRELLPVSWAAHNGEAGWMGVEDSVERSAGIRYRTIICKAKPRWISIPDCLDVGWTG